MTHAVVLVVVPDAAGIEQVERTAAKMLAPYDENLDVEPYREYPDEEELSRMRKWFEEEWGHAPTMPELVEVMPRWRNVPGYLDDEGRLYVMSTYNSHSKWDWWQVGGRYRDNAYAQFAVDTEHPSHLRAEKFNLDVLPWAPYSVLTPDGKWHSRGRLGWFGMSSGDDEEEVWKEKVRALLAPYLVPGVALLVVDYHI